MQRLAPQSALIRGYIGQHQNTMQESWRDQLAETTENSKSDICRTEVTQVFEKKFQYQQQPQNGLWQLPLPKELFGEFYQFETLQQLKQTLNNVKCKLNDYELEKWGLHTRRQDPCNEVPWRLKNETKAEFVTIAWCKFYECLQSYPLVKSSKLNSLHLCELPGAFIAALNHYMYSTYASEEVSWNWLSTTLNPYYEGNPTSGMITDDRFMFLTFDNWLMHNDFTGNIINCGNIEQMEQQCAKRLQDNVHLITADGSIDCADAPDCQEEVVATLHFAEITTALSILADGGCFVLKMFTLFESTNVCKMFLLNCCFDKVHVFKPATSKRGNSEVYIICLGYRKHTKHLPEILQLMKQKIECNNVLPLFAKAHLPKDFLVQHEICARMFMNFQINAIESNIYTYEIKPTRREVMRKQLLRTQIGNEFYSRYKVQPIARAETILWGKRKTTQETYKSTCFSKGSYTARELAKVVPFEEQVFSLHRKVNELEKYLGNHYGTLWKNESITTDTHKEPEIRIYKGTPFPILNSSHFVNTHVITLYNQFVEVLGHSPLCQETQSCSIGNQQILLDEAIAYNYSYVQCEFFTKILNLIIKTHPQQIIYTNVAFLTHFAVSILHFLAFNIFEHIAICTEPSFQITLQTNENEYGEWKLTALKKLYDLLTNDINIMCIADIEQLHRNPFSNAVVEYNSQLLLNNFKLILKN